MFGAPQSNWSCQKVSNLAERVWLYRLVLQTGRVAAVRAVPVLAIVALARYLGAAEFGVYSYTMSSTGILVTIGLLGLDRLLVRDVAICGANGAWTEARALLRWAVAVSVSFAALLSVAIVLLRSFLETHLGIPATACLVAAVLLPTLALANIQQGLLRGLNRVLTSQLPLSVVRPLAMLAALGMMTEIFGIRRTAVASLVSTTLATLAAVWVGAKLIVRTLPKGNAIASPAVASRARLVSSARFLMISGLSSLSAIEVVVLGAHASPAVVGAYTAALQCASLVPVIQSMIMTSASPAFAALHATGSAAALQQLLRRCWSLAMIVGIPLAALLAVRGHRVLEHIYGPGFAQANAALIILLAGQSVNLAAGPVATLLSMTGHEQDTVLGLVVAAVVNISLSLVLIPRLGINGAAVAGAAGLASWNLLLTWRVNRRLGLIWPFTARPLMS